MNKSVILAAAIMALPKLCVYADTAVPISGDMMIHHPGQITLTWEEFQKIWDELQHLKSAKPPNVSVPPVDYVLSRARYAGRVRNGVFEMTVQFELNILKDKAWTAVNFLPSSSALEEALLDGKPAAVNHNDRYHSILTQSTGRHELTARFSLPYPKSEEVPMADVSIVSTAMTLFELELPRAHVDAKVTPSEGVRIREADGKTLIAAALPPTESIHIEWQKKIPAEAKLPPKLYADDEQLVSVGENTIQMNTTINYSILHSAVPSVRILIPEGANVLAVQSGNLREWKLQEEKGRKILIVEFTFAQRGAAQVMVQSELSAAGAVAGIPSLIALDTERERGVIGVEARGSIEIKTDESKDLRPIDVKELPPGVWRTAKNPLLLAYRYNRQPYRLSLDVQRHADVPVLTTTVDSAHAVTLFLKEGLAVTHASYQVRNRLKQFLSFALPKGSEVWSASVGGQPVKPALDASHRLLVPLAKSGEMDGNSSFPVEIIYYTKAPKFHWLGYRAIEVPAPDVPVSQMLWSVYMPEKYRFPKFWGDMDWADFSSGPQPFAANGEPIQLQSRMDQRKGLFGRAKKAWSGALRNMAKAADMPMMSALGAVAGAGGASAASDESDQVAERQAEMERGFVDKLSAGQAGILPVAFNIPARGQLYRFDKLVVVGENPVLKTVYVHIRLLQLDAAVLALLFVRFLYARRRLLIDWLRGGIDFARSAAMFLSLKPKNQL